MTTESGHGAPDAAMGLDAALADEVKQTARELIAGGYMTADEVAQAVVEIHSEPDDQPPIAQAQAQRIVAPLWAERLAQQAEWPERTDFDALKDAFGALERRNIVARDNFSCCTRCGHGEIHDETGPDSVGYVFFHQQATDRAVCEGRLWLYFGTCSVQQDAGEDADGPDVAVGRAVVEEIARVGLPVEWNGEGGKAILVAPIEWRKRLPVGADDEDEDG